MASVQVAGSAGAAELRVRLPLPPPGLGSAELLGLASPLDGLGLLRLKEPSWGRCSGPGLRRQLGLTYHRGLDEAPRVGLWNVRLQDARSSAGLVHSTEHVDLAATHGGCRRVHGLGQRGHGLPLVGDGVIPIERAEEEPRVKGGLGSGQEPRLGQQTLGASPSASCPAATGPRSHSRGPLDDSLRAT